MSLDPDAAEHLMGVLTNLYSDAEAACVREYSTNALDSHVEAGVSRPIEVTTPTPLSPFFRVRDYGTGLDVEDIRNIYSRYGASSKRNSNDVVGMLGLGCKSALTYTDQFTLTSVKNGKAVQVSVSRNENGGGSMTIVDEYETDDPSGVEVVIPAKGVSTFETKARNFFRFWKPGTVLLNGEEPKRIGGLWITDDLLLTSEADRPLVVMGNVPYPVTPEDAHYNHAAGNYDTTAVRFPSYRLPNPQHQYDYTFHSLVAFVNIGDVHFTPSREALKWTTKTKETIKNTRARFEKLLDASLVDKINAAPTKHEAVQIALDATSYSKNIKLVYKGKEIPKEVVRPSGEDQLFVAVEAEKPSYDKGWGVLRALDIRRWSRTTWIVGYDAYTFSPYRRKKLTQWAAKNDIVANHYTFTDKIPAEIVEWINPDNVYDWDVINAEKIDRTPGQQRNINGRVSGSYDALVNGVFTSNLLAVDIDTTKPIYWTPRHSSVDPIFGKGATVVYLNSNRINKFVRDFPMAVKWQDAFKTMANDWVTNLTDDQKLHLGVTLSGNVSILRPLDPAKIVDPEIKGMIEAVKGKDNSLIEKHSQFRYAIKMPNFMKEIEDRLNRYPILTSVGHYATMNDRFKDHLYTYINAVFAAEQETVKNAV
jgi:hypothetical protein